jgi:hypothetical protein
MPKSIRLAWRVFAVAASVVVLLVAAVVVWQVVLPERVRTQTLSYSGVQKIVVDVGDGDVTLQPAATGAVVVQERLAWTTVGRPGLTGTVDGSVLTIGGGCSGSVWQRLGGRCTTGLTVSVPDGMPVSVTVEAGDVRVAGLTGPLLLRASAGSIRGDGLRSGSVDAHIDSGDIGLSFAAVPRTVTAVAETGDVTVALARGAYHVLAEPGQGERDIQVGDDPAATATVTARSSFGGVHIHYS